MAEEDLDEGEFEVGGIELVQLCLRIRGAGGEGRHRGSGSKKDMGEDARTDIRPLESLCIVY
jgi:hypothetical protein